MVFENARHTENPALLKEINKLHKQLLNCNQENLSATEQDKERADLIMQIYANPERDYPEIYKAYHKNHIKAVTSEIHSSALSQAYYSIRYLLPRFANIAVVLLSAIALTPPTNAGIKSFTKSVFGKQADITEWGSFFVLLPEAYFLGQNVDLASRLILDCFEKIIHRISNIVCKSSATEPYQLSRKDALRLMNTLSILSACTYLAWRSISTAEEQIAAAPINPYADYTTEPASYLINEKAILKIIGASAVTAGAGLANLKAIFTVIDKFTNKVRAYFLPTHSDEAVKKIDKLGELIEKTTMTWKANFNTTLAESNIMSAPENNV